MAGFMTPQVVTAPAAYPVGLAEVRARLRLETTEDDADLASLIAAATEMAEAYTGRALIERTYRGFLGCFPACRHIDLPRAPLQSVVSVKAYADDDSSVTVDAADYYVDAASLSGRIVLRSGASWPTVGRVANGVEVQWVAGYPDMNDVPADMRDSFRSAILILVGWLNEQRGDEASPKAMPPAAEALLNPWRIYWI